MNYKILNNNPIVLSNMEIPVQDILKALINTNKLLNKIYYETENLGLNVFKVVDFRVFSGMIGEMFSKELESINCNLIKNPYISGYPDLLQVSTDEMYEYYKNCNNENLIKFKFGGVEVKNTFGTKKSKCNVLMGEKRILSINSKLDWKAHHRETNFLLGLLSDYINGIPQIVSICYCDELTIDDWNKKQNPKGDSAMTSFSAISPKGYRKMKSGIKICIDKKEYLDFFR
ncbi:hypothetical protein LI064_10190 [Clostridium perfringens]|uniref:hypothetical protein n=1 Tax=Clostridium perfringens TaxID=1502 RepID=UPI0022485E03|nr:hypothetical protein [Clostridium perfringens]MCX0354880.1 hypothetical protein [Clostridium perfringens]MDM0800980.1 hypothetical protein [Clostridium perfringens]